MLEQNRTNEEVTSEEVPDPTPLPEIGGDYLLVRPVNTTADKIGSIYIPDSTMGDVKYLHNVGRILAFGPRAYKTKEGNTIDWFHEGLKVGDIIQWERYVGKKFRYKGVNLVLLKDVAAQLKVGDAKDLDPMTSIED